MMLKLEDITEFKMVPFMDERRFCSECTSYKVTPFRGLCRAQIQQYNMLNRCSQFTEKNKAEDKPFWE